MSSYFSDLGLDWFEHRPQDDVVELVWENNQISTQNLSKKSRNLQDLANTEPRIFRSNSPARTDYDVDLVPWLNHPLDESLQTSYCSDFFPDMSEATTNGQEHGEADQTATPFFHTRRNSNVLNQSERVRNIAGNDHGCRELDRIIQNQDPEFPNPKPSVINFPHFLRTAAIAKANLHGSSVRATDEIGISNKEETRLIESDNSPTNVVHIEDKVLDLSVSSDPAKFAASGSSSKDNEKNNLILENSCRKNHRSEHAVQCSSVCSRNNNNNNNNNNLDGPYDGPLRSLKRNRSDTHDVDYHSEDNKDESMDAGKTGPFHTGSGSKRCRSARVHNLSERKRRDRINEKMRSLQELIPNCNKVDKASMLEEAIEYLKSLQLQVQMMSMGAGPYMPPMIYASGLQHMHMAAYMPQYPAMGMRYPDMCGVAHRAPMAQPFPQFPGAHPAIAIPRGPEGFFMKSNSPMNVNRFGVAEPNKTPSGLTKEGSKDVTKNIALKPSIKVSDKVYGSS